LGYKDMVDSTKNYLRYLKEIGIEELPYKGRGKIAEKQELLSLEAVRNDLGNCKRCKLHGHRTNIVFGCGSPNAGLVFVGVGARGDDMKLVMKELGLEFPKRTE